MIAIEFMQDSDVGHANTALTQAVIAKAAEHGLILLSCGFYSNVIRFLPALTMSDDIANEGLDKFEQLLDGLLQGTQELTTP